MALLINDKFEPRANPGDANYPNGSIKNESAPGAKDGTPLDADWGNDYVGFDAALFAETGITPDGNPDTALSSQRLDALKKVSSKITNTKYNPTTIQDAIDYDDWNVVGGEVFRVQGYHSAGVGGGTWKTIIKGTTAGVDLPNNSWIRACAGVPNLAIKLDFSDGYVANQFGVVGDAVIDNSGDVATGYTPNGPILNEIAALMGRDGGELKFLKGNYEVTGWVNNSANLTIVGIGTKVSRLIGMGSGVTFLNHPLRNNVPYGAKGSSGLFIVNCQFYAGDSPARLLGTGIRMVDCYVTKFDRMAVLGFKNNISIFGGHFNKFEHCYNANEVITNTNPDLDIDNRGYAIVAEQGTSPAFQPVSTGIKLDGGWYSNTSFDFRNMANGVITNIDIEPANDTVLIGSRFHIHNNRFERMDLFALPPYERYARFPWFEFLGDNNLFENNNIHTTGANNQSFVNPKIKVSSNNNTFKFEEGTIVSGLIDFGSTTSGNYAEIGHFKDWEFFGPAIFPAYHCESNTGLFEGALNNYKLKEDNSSIEVTGREIKVSGFIESVTMPNAPLVQGATGSAGAYTLDGSGNNRVILNFNSTDTYQPGFMYAIKFNVRSDSGVSFTAAPSFTLDFNSGQTSGNQKYDQWLVWRFYIPTGENSVVINPAIKFSGSIGDTFTLSGVEVLKMNSGEYTENNYILP